MTNRTDLEVPIRIDRASSLPIHQQLTEALRQAIRAGTLPPGSRLPSSRTLAATIGISRNVVLTAFDELYAEGYIEGHLGSGTFVTRDLPTAPQIVTRHGAPSPRWPEPQPPIASEETDPLGFLSFRLGVPSTSPMPSESWRRLWRDVADSTPPKQYLNPAGEPRLRTAIASYLGRSRGVTARADDLVITTGAAQAIDLLIQATIPAGGSAAIEDPGYPTARRLMQLRNASVVPIPIDDDGLRVECLPSRSAAPNLVYVTPSHQYPIGVRMSIARRLALLEWAEANDAIIVEDDYDGEFRFGAPPLPALAGLDTAGRVVYIGTFSKVVIPGLRVGYLLVPGALRERIVMLKRLTDHHTPWAEQLALTGFCERGDLERHIRRMRRFYAENRAILASALAPIADRGLGRLQGLDAGLHAFFELRDDLDPNQIVARCRTRQVIVSTLDGYFAGAPDRHGLLLGYGGLDPAEVRRGASVLAEVIGELSSQSMT